MEERFSLEKGMETRKVEIKKIGDVIPGFDDKGARGFIGCAYLYTKSSANKDDTLSLLQTLYDKDPSFKPFFIFNKTKLFPIDNLDSIPDDFWSIEGTNPPARNPLAIIFWIESPPVIKETGDDYGREKALKKMVQELGKKGFSLKDVVNERIGELVSINNEELKSSTDEILKIYR